MAGNCCWLLLHSVSFKVSNNNKKNKKKHQNNVSDQFTIKIDARTTSSAFIVNFEHISHFVLLYSNK